MSVCLVLLASFLGPFQADAAERFATGHDATVDGPFFPGLQTIGLSGPIELLLEDVNGDGALDAVVSELALSRLSVLLGDASGQFAFHSSLDLSSWPRDIEVLSRGPDGAVDLVVSIDSPAEVLVLRNDGGGTFTVSQTLTAPVIPLDLAVGPLFHPRARDIVFVGSNDSSLYAFPQLVDGSFGPVRSRPLGVFRPDRLELGDLDGDGLAELAVAERYSGEVALLIRGPHGLEETSLATDGGPYDLAFVDLDEDGAQDLVTLGVFSVGTFLGDGSGVVGTRQDQDLSIIGDTIHFEDVDADGQRDLVVVANGGCAILPGLGRGAFGTELRTNAGGLDAEVARVDGDEFADLVSLSYPGDAIEFHAGTASGTFPSFLYLAGREFGPCAGFDLTGDGILDLVGTEPSVDETLFLYEGLGEDQYALIETHPLADGLTDLRLANVVGDASLDIVVSDSGPDEIHVFEGAGDGTFLPFVVHDYASPTFHVGGGDLDTDGYEELLLTQTFIDSLLVLVAETGEVTSYPVAELGLVRPLCADFDQDGRLDVVVAGGDTVQLLRGFGDRTLDSGATVFDAGATIRGLVEGDWNGDGRLDLVATDANGVLHVLEATGAGGFAALQQHTVGTDARHIRTSDLDSDGRLDLLVSSQDPYSLRVFLGQVDGTFAFENAYAYMSLDSPMPIFDRDGDGAKDVYLGGVLGVLPGLPPDGR